MPRYRWVSRIFCLGTLLLCAATSVVAAATVSSTHFSAIAQLESALLSTVAPPACALGCAIAGFRMIDDLRHADNLQAVLWGIVGLAATIGFLLAGRAAAGATL